MAKEKDTFFSKKVTLLNVIATVMIVIHHAETPIRWGQPLDLHTYPFIWAVYTLTQVAVPLFFFISALLFYRNCEWRDIPAKLYRRIFSLVIPFIIWNVFFVAVYWVLRQIPFTADKMTLVKPLDTPAQWLYAIWNTSFTPLWFIKYLIYFCLMSPVVLLLVKNKWVGITASAGLFAVSIICKWNGVYNLFYWLPVYLMGAVVGRHLYGPGRNESNRLFVNLGQSCRTKFTLLLTVVLIAFYLWGILNDGSWTYGRFICPAAIWFLADLALPSYFGETFKVRDWMGYTFFIFATHYFLLNIEQTLVRTYLPATPIVLNLTFIVSPIITLLIIIWAARLLSRFKFYKILTGGR